MNLQQEIAKKFAESGLFDEYDKLNVPAPEPEGEHFEDWLVRTVADQTVEAGPYLTADKAEEILKELSLQMVYVYGETGETGWYFNTLTNEQAGFDDELNEPILFEHPGERTLANNAGIAWLLDNKREQLETAFKDLGKL